MPGPDSAKLDQLVKDLRDLADLSKRNFDAEHRDDGRILNDIADVKRQVDRNQPTIDRLTKILDGQNGTKSLDTRLAMIEDLADQFKEFKGTMNKVFIALFVASVTGAGGLHFILKFLEK